MKYLPIILIVVAPCYLKAQVFIAAEGTYSSYSMKELKQFQQESAQSISPDLKTVTNFPSYFGWGVNGGYSINDKVSLGASFRYMSTGARSDIRDYSGQITYDQLLQSYSAGIFVRAKIFTIKKLGGYLGANTYYVRTSDELISTAKAGTQSDSDRARLKGHGIGFVPSLQVFYSLTSEVFLYATAGYESQVQKKLKYQGQETNLHAQWDGLRFTLGIGYQFNKHQPPDK